MTISGFNLRQEMQALRSRVPALLGFSAEGAVAAATATDELQAAEARIQAPLLIIAAGATKLPEAEIFLQGLQNLAQRHPDATFQLVPDAGHYVQASHAQLVASHIQEWLQANGLGS